MWHSASARFAILLALVPYATACDAGASCGICLRLLDAAEAHVYPSGQLKHAVEPVVAAVGNRAASVSS